MSAFKRVLSVQSHVVSGYVGNKAAVFPLQLLGFDVDPINSVHFSNHTGYPHRTGTVMNGEELADIVEGLQTNGLLCKHSHLLTGFIGSPSFLQGIVELLQKMRAGGHSVRHVCDPVLGDNGRLYVPKELVPLYKECIVPHASLLTPNHFELQLLSGKTVTSITEAVEACKVLHDMGAESVVVTSLESQDADDSILVLVSSSIPQSGCPTPFYIKIPKMQAYFSGCDLLAALLLAHTAAIPQDLATATERACATLQEVLRRTADSAGEYRLSPERTSKVMGARELKLVQSADAILHPQVEYRAVHWKG